MRGGVRGSSSAWVSFLFSALFASRAACGALFSFVSSVIVSSTLEITGGRSRACARGLMSRRLARRRGADAFPEPNTERSKDRTIRVGGTLHINGIDRPGPRPPSLHVCRQLRAATVSGCARAARKHCSVKQPQADLYISSKRIPRRLSQRCGPWRHCCSSAQQRCSRQLRDASTRH